jgi:hypothetical protein
VYKAVKETVNIWLILKGTKASFDLFELQCQATKDIDVLQDTLCGSSLGLISSNYMLKIFTLLNG